LQTALQSLQIGTGNDSMVFAPTVWTTNLFNASSGIQFDGNGNANRGAYIIVVSARSGRAVVADGPVGVILVTTSGNLFRYFRSSPTANWVKL
jgi:hypothetical protein